MDNIRDDEFIFISYSWVYDRPDESVMHLVAQLRSDGYNAICDVLRLQEETAMSFNVMMAKSFLRAKKIIIVLSKSYKEKADSFKGGVGKEYEYIISDIAENKNKYILVSFDNDIPSVLPDFIKGRQVVSLYKHYDLLLHKLNDTLSYVFPPVGDEKVKPGTIYFKAVLSEDTRAQAHQHVGKINALIEQGDLRTALYEAYKFRDFCNSKGIADHNIDEVINGLISNA